MARLAVKVEGKVSTDIQWQYPPWGPPYTLEAIADSPALTDAHQGICSDGEYYYTSGSSGRIRKYDSAWNLVATADGTKPTKPGDCDVYDGVLYVTADGWLHKFAASDLSPIGSWQGSHGTGAGCCVRDGSEIVTISHTYSDRMERYTLGGSHLGTLWLSGPTISLAQGLTFWRGAFWVAGWTGSGNVIRVEADGAVYGPVFDNPGSAHAIGHRGNSLLINDGALGATVTTITPA